MPTNWPDRVGAVGRGLLRFGAALCAKKPSSRRSENHCIYSIYRKSFDEEPAGSEPCSEYERLFDDLCPMSIDGGSSPHAIHGAVHGPTSDHTTAPVAYDGLNGQLTP